MLQKQYVFLTDYRFTINIKFIAFAADNRGQQLKLRVHAREWTASKLHPKVYGQQIDVSDQHTQISVLAALALAEQRVIGSA
jgi:hypothetical protein